MKGLDDAAALEDSASRTIHNHKEDDWVRHYRKGLFIFSPASECTKLMRDMKTQDQECEIRGPDPSYRGCFLQKGCRPKYSYSPPDAIMPWQMQHLTTNAVYLCNSVMLFETLERLGSKADRLLMYSSGFVSSDGNPNGSSKESQLLMKARDQYNVKLQSINVQRKDVKESTWAESYSKLEAFNQTQYDRVLSLDSDATLLQVWLALNLVQTID